MYLRTGYLRVGMLLAAAACIAVLFSGCGFQPRGRANLTFDRIYVETDGFSLFGAELRRVIQSGSAAEVVDTAAEAQVVLKILNERQQQKILSLSGAGSVREFELIYSVAYRIMDNQLKDLVAPGEIVLRRDLLFDDSLRLAKESEAEFLYRDMQTDAVQQMLRRLSVIQYRS